MIPRAEHPRPHFYRESWENLNGTWEFELDPGRSGVDRRLFEAERFSRTITVPFCPESELSGVGEKDFLNAVWYRKKVEIHKDGSRVLLHFGAVDYLCRVWVNGREAGSHRGGYASFTLDITQLAADGENVITVYAEDNLRDGCQPRGKQSSLYYSNGCDYTRTTGIWQTVWLEYVPQCYLQSAKVVTDAGSKVSITVALGGTIRPGSKVKITASYEGNPMGSISVPVCSHTAVLPLKVEEVYLWEPGHGRLYDYTCELIEDGVVTDQVLGYFGIRSLLWQDGKMLLNGKPVFQRLVLDQGFYPDGIYTAPSDEALRRDIELSMAAGFNGARLHQKVFEERFLYWADKLGYLVWGEQGSWGLDHSRPESVLHFLPEWMEIVQRDISHPAIVGWCPFNETWDVNGRKQCDDVLRTVYLATKAIDPTRPVIDTSGGYHVVTDIYDIHDYEQSVDVYRERYEKVAQGDYFDPFPNREQYQGQPYFVSEFGGARWAPADSGGWGYGNAPRTEEELAERYAGLAGALLSCKNVCAFCYTQLTDIEQEQNGLYHYDRTPKFKPEIYEKIRAANQQPAAIEEE